MAVLPKPVQFRAGTLTDDLLARTRGGGDAAVGYTARRDLERYYAVLRAELALVGLGEAELSLVRDALNGTLLDEGTFRLLWAEVDDAIRLRGLDATWGVDGPALVERLRALTPGQTMALVDAVERW